MRLFKGSSGTVGSQMEAAAGRYLQRAGLTLMERNYRSSHGEIDLIARESDTIVFVEVRFRRKSQFGGAAASVDSRKQAKLLATANRYLQQHKLDCPCRFDVLAIDGDAQNIQWLKNAFEA
ncbi:YraN family protein [Microbulbifer sp. VAAF005]|uniref:YraN family protein n=1 Tax=Microbulbifer sp. VAAF005 TaxID=3034230 RepID=UPI0024AD624F|nr:YraN family protein [Microbulbifer sp. VAAF005]WHI48296.1 YraN family protein [Microbulbifer sp. VAAF005]